MLAVGLRTGNLQCVLHVGTPCLPSLLLPSDFTLCYNFLISS